MNHTYETQDGFLTNGDSLEPNYWQERINNDAQFMQFMIEVYKSQRLDKGKNETNNKQVNHQTQQQITNQIPRLMEQPANASPIQQPHQQDHVRTTKTSMGDVYDNSTPVNQISSTLRRQLEESNSPDKGYKRL